MNEDSIDWKKILFSLVEKAISEINKQSTSQ